jgi:hypothetical protein
MIISIEYLKKKAEVNGVDLELSHNGIFFSVTARKGGATYHVKDFVHKFQDEYVQELLKFINKHDAKIKYLPSSNSITA